MIASINVMNHRSKVLFPGKVLLLLWMLMRALCLSSMVVVSRGCPLLRFCSRPVHCRTLQQGAHVQGHR